MQADQLVWLGCQASVEIMLEHKADWLEPQASSCCVLRCLHAAWCRRQESLRT